MLSNIAVLHCALQPLNTMCSDSVVHADLIDDSRPHQLELGVDDSIQQPHWRHRLRMPRSLLAVVLVQLLLLRDEGEQTATVLTVAVQPCGCCV